jgi:hypothetical protein
MPPVVSRAWFVSGALVLTAILAALVSAPHS